VQGEGDESSPEMGGEGEGRVGPSGWCSSAVRGSGEPSAASGRGGVMQQEMEERGVPVAWSERRKAGGTLLKGCGGEAAEGGSLGSEGATRRREVVGAWPQPASVAWSLAGSGRDREKRGARRVGRPRKEKRSGPSPDEQKNFQFT
jgi:hypothetical protein